MNKRYNNYGLWVSIVAFIGMILGNYGLYDVLGLNADSYKQLADALLSIFVLAGILNNPTTDTKSFLDDKK